MKQLVCAVFLFLSFSVQAGEWIADFETGCKVWNQNPQPKESIKWFGPCINGFAHGQGLLQWYLDGKPGERGEGEWRNGKANGYVVYTWMNGNRYEGEWRDNRKSGYGVLTTPGGMRYEGEWADGDMAGEGVLTLPNGLRYEGALHKGRPEGFGVMNVPRKAYVPRHRSSLLGHWVGEVFVEEGLFKGGYLFLSCSSQAACVAKQRRFQMVEVGLVLLGIMLVAFGCYRNRHLFTFFGILCLPYAGLIHLWSIGIINEFVRGFMAGLIR